MKVFCINNLHPKTPHLLKPEHWIYEGEIYTVSSSYFDTRDGHEYYYLQERADLPRPSYRANRFLPLSETDQDSENHHDHHTYMCCYSKDYQLVLESGEW